MLDIGRVRALCSRRTTPTLADLLQQLLRAVAS
jgi:hypothetical protein